MILRGRARSVAHVDLNAIRHNVGLLSAALTGGSRLCVVLKADGYGHGAVPVGRAAMEAGAAWLGVSTVAEAQQLRAAGLTLPVLVFGPMTGPELYCAVAAEAQVVAWSRGFAEAARKAGALVHVKFDSGMGRLGVNEEEALALAAIVAEGPSRLIGLMSHFATADWDDLEFFFVQLERFAAFAAVLRRQYPDLLCHIANSAATLREPRSHFDMVRCGIAVYGLDPCNRDPYALGLWPAMRWSSYLAGERMVQPGESVGYGRRFIAEEPTRIGIVPIGYGDGVCRALSNRGDVLIAGHRCRISGTMSMDQMTVRLPEQGCQLGDEVVLIGESGDQRILCEDIAHLLGTINYEVVSDVSPRTVRRYLGKPWEG